MEKKKPPLITVVIPCFNEALFIEKTIRSLMDDYVLANSEILIADANSLDGTRDIVSNMIKEGFPFMTLTPAANRFKIDGMGQCKSSFW